MGKKESFFTRLLRDMKVNWILYVMMIPVLVYFAIFHYTPMYGILMAFKDFNSKLGIAGSEWVGFEHFVRFFSSYNFWNLIKNTLTLSVYSLVVGFPLPIIFALMLNYLTSKRLKKTVQMVSYAPHFISTVVLCGMVTIFSNVDTGVFNVILNALGFESVNFLAEPKYFKHLHVLSGIWQSTGWSAIIYISALAGVDAQMHEAAIVDGATKIQRMIHIDLPSIKPTIIMMLILRFGQIMSVGFEKVYLLQNDLNQSAASIISTYVYEVGLINNNYSYSTAINLFNTIINVILIVSANTISRKLADESLF